MMDTTAYWMDRGKVYKDQHARLNPVSKFRFWLQEFAICNALRSTGLTFRSVLEVGCGYGRIAKLLLECEDLGIERYVATDISLDQLKNAQDLTNDFNVEYRQMSIDDLDYDSEFDLIIASEVLMHVPPERIHDAIGKILRSGKGIMLNVDWHAPKEPDMVGGYCFQHDYESLYGDRLIKSIPLWPHRLMRQNIFLVNSK
jgi:2-polyprenyl-3-methyl-5-hydroxy-6-metoxy-1,4-benzoquinol methylase